MKNSDLIAGTKVFTNRQKKYDRTYTGSTNEARDKCNHRVGVVCNQSNAHGLCYQVEFANGLKAWFEPKELTVVNE